MPLNTEIDPSPDQADQVESTSSQGSNNDATATTEAESSVKQRDSLPHHRLLDLLKHYQKDHAKEVTSTRQIWSGLDGALVSAFGIALPLFLMFVSVSSMPKRLTLVLLNHPVETAVELLLLAAIPLTNFLIWNSICKDRVRFSSLRSLLLGMSAGAALAVSGVCWAAIFCASEQISSISEVNFTTGFTWLALLSAGSAATTGYIALSYAKASQFSSTKSRLFRMTVYGTFVSILLMVTVEFKPWFTRYVERASMSSDPGERAQGLQTLRLLNPERDLLMESSDDRAAGLVGLFVPLKPGSQRSLYFTLTGRPFSFRDINAKDLASMPDEYLSRHVVGDVIPELHLVRSCIYGTPHTRTYSATIDWTFVLGNDSPFGQEARAELSMPPGTVPTKVEIWKDGEKESSVCVLDGKAVQSGASPLSGAKLAKMTDLGHGRVLVQCSPVSPGRQLKVKATFIEPMTPDGVNAANLMLPSIVASNFDLKGNHEIVLRSDNSMKSLAKNLECQRAPNGDSTVHGELSADQISKQPPVITVTRPPLNRPIIALDIPATVLARKAAHDKEIARQNRLRTQEASQPQQQIVVQIDGSRGLNEQLDSVSKALSRSRKSNVEPRKLDLKSINRFVVSKIDDIQSVAPKHLYVVLDGSTTTKDNLNDLIAGLKAIPATVQTSLLLASQESGIEKGILPLDKALGNIEKLSFIGGQDNLETIVKATNIAGENENSAVLWIHGPLPAQNEQIFVTPPFRAKPAFYDLALGTGATDINDLLKNHSEVGPFLPVPRGSNKLSDDLIPFFSKWNQSAKTYAAAISESTRSISDALPATKEETNELLALNASRRCREYLENRSIEKATDTASNYEIVSPVSSAVVLEEAQQLASNTNANSNNRPEEENADAYNGNSNNAVKESPTGQVNDSNPGTSWKIRANYFLRFPVAQENGLNSDPCGITGLNTAGTVRVNNLANLEAMLNMVANGLQILGLICGAVSICSGLLGRSKVLRFGEHFIKIGPAQLIIGGLVLIFFGACVTGVINWFVASARDANLFS